MGASDAGVVGKNHDSGRISGFRIDDCWSTTNKMTVDHAAVYSDMVERPFTTQTATDQ